MTNKNYSYLTKFGKVFFVAADVAIISPMAYATLGFSTTTEQKLVTNEAGDRIVICLSDTQNRFITYSEFEAEKVAIIAEVSAFLYKALVSTGDIADISSQYAVGQKEQAQVKAQGKKPRQHCNQKISNSSEDCNPSNSYPHGGSNDEGGRTPSGKK